MALRSMRLARAWLCKAARQQRARQLLPHRDARTMAEARARRSASASHHARSACECSEHGGAGHEGVYKHRRADGQAVVSLLCERSMGKFSPPVSGGLTA